jgi:hypothetical protein
LTVQSGGSIFTSPGTSGTLTLVVENVGNFDDTLDLTSSLTLSLSGNDSNTGWLIGDGTSGTLDVNESGTIELSLVVPDLAWNGTVASVEIVLTADGLLLGTFTVDIEVISQPLWIVRATGSDLDVAASGSNITLELEQRGNLPARAFVSASIAASGWNLTVPENLPSLDPGQTLIIEIYVVPPAGAISGPTAELTIIARNGDGRGMGQTILPLRIRPEYDFTAAIPNNWEGWLVSDSGGMPRLTIANTGNAANQFSIELIGLPAGWSPSQADISLAWGEMKGVPIDLIPNSGWDHSNFTIELRLTDAGGKVVSLNTEVAFSEVAWASSPVMWGVLGDDKVVNFHGSAVNSVTSGGDSLSQTQNGWVLPAPNGDGDLTVSGPNGDVLLFYTAHMQTPVSRNVACLLDANLSRQPVASCDIGNGTQSFSWSILLRAEDGTLVNSRNGVVGANSVATVNLTSSGWNPTVGIHELTILVFSSDGRLQESESQQYVVRASGWNIGLGLEEAASGDINILISRENHQIMTSPICSVKLNQGNWSKIISIDITSTLAPKLSVDRPSGGSTLPVNATFSCAAPWDIDDDPADNIDDLLLSTQTNILVKNSDLLYGTGFALLIIAVLWLLGLIRPARLGPAPAVVKKTVRQERKIQQPKPQTAAKQVEAKESSVQFEEDGETDSEPEETITEIQESLIEIEAAEPEPPEEELDEFELRLKQLRDRRKNSG